MSNVPYVLPSARWGARLQDNKMVDALMHGFYAGSEFVKYPADGPFEAMRGKVCGFCLRNAEESLMKLFVQPYIMGMTAEFLVQKHGISGKEQNEVH